MVDFTSIPLTGLVITSKYEVHLSVDHSFLKEPDEMIQF